jgi:hypothetical protein
MKKILTITILVLLTSCFTAFSQTNKQSPADTIILFGGEKITGIIQRITSESVIYKKSANSEQESVNRNRVNKIQYSSGKTEVINESPKKPGEKIDWRKVKVLKNKKQVLGMTKVEDLEASAKGSGRGYETPKSLKRRATVILRKKAAKINANYVLIVKESVSAAFGEIPSVTIEAKAYRDY